MTATPEEILVRFTQSQPLFTALGAERRQAIIILLLKAGAARSVGEIAAQLELSQPAVSHHLENHARRTAAYCGRQGTQRRYALNTAEYAELLALMRNSST